MANGRKFNADFKARVAMEAIKGRKTAAEISSEFEVHSSQISHWKKQALDGLKNIFSSVYEKSNETLEKKVDKLYQQIGKLQVENEYLKKTVYRG